MIYSACTKQDSLLVKQPALRTRQPSRLESGPITSSACPSSTMDGSLEEIVRLSIDDADQFDLDLAALILERIQVRLPGRVRQLAVYTTENAVILTGQCSTFYTKQVAQHAAMGVLEYEQLINNIDVRTLK